MQHLFTTIAIEEKGNTLVIHVLEQRLSLTIADKFKEEVTNVLELKYSNLIIDLSRVNVINSSGLGVLILARDRMLKKGGKLIICGLRPVMKEIFTRMNLEVFFDIAENVEEALQMVSGNKK